MAVADTALAPIECDALVIGAGPVGLFQVFQLGLQDIRAELVDALPAPGGQCTELYGDKPIYDIPALPVCTGQELTERLLQQIAPFKPRFHLSQVVTALAPRADGRFDLATSSGQRFMARSVFIAGGVGAFQARQLKVDGADQLPASQLLYRLPEPGTLAGRHVLIVGGEDAAVQAVLELADQLADQLDGPAAQRPAQVTLLHRRATLSADTQALLRLQSHVDAGRIGFKVGQITALQLGGPAAAPLQAVQLIGDDDQTHRLATDALLVCLGISPKLGPIANWGLALQRRQLVVDTAHFETSTPGIYAVGDLVTYPGKRKLILCGFHEATLAAFAAAQRLRPDTPVLLQYTTTSPKLQRLLGVATPPRGD